MNELKELEESLSRALNAYVICVALKVIREEKENE